MLTEETGFLPLTSGLVIGTRPIWLSIPMSFAKDIAGKEVLTLGAVVEVLKFWVCKGSIVYWRSTTVSRVIKCWFFFEKKEITSAPAGRTSLIPVVPEPLHLVLWRYIRMAWHCTGKTNAELINNMRKSGIFHADRTAKVSTACCQYASRYSY